MFFRKKPNRLYIPTTSRWYTRPRRRRGLANERRVPRVDLRKILSELLQNRMRALVIALLGAVFLLILASSSYFAIRNIDVIRGDFNIDSAAIENALKGTLGKNILFFPKSLIAKTIQDQFPEFQSVNVQKKMPGTIIISLTSYPIVANLKAYYVLPPAQEKPAETTPPTLLEQQAALEAAFALTPKPIKKPEGPPPVEQKSLLNQVGQAIFDQEENLELITIVVKGLTQPIEDRQQIIPPAAMQYLRDTLQYLGSSLNLKVLGVEVLPIARELHIKIERNVTLWLTLEKDFKEQLDKLKTIYEPAELNKEDLSYIDLRVKEKVIYCPRRAPCAQ